MSMRFSFLRRIVSFAVSALFLLCALLSPAGALAAKSTAASPAAFVETLECDQFSVGRDSNSFPHSSSAFPSTYALSSEYQEKLFSMATQSEYGKIVEYLQKKWGGSCYGVSLTMALNRLTKDGKFSEGEGMLASDMQSGAEDYFDIGKPKENPQVLDIINFYMLSQMASVTRQNAAVTTSLRRYTDKTMKYSKLAELADRFMSFVDAGKPFQVSYFYLKNDPSATPGAKKLTGGHAIMGLDYFISNKNGNPYKLYLKCYDENDRGSCEYYNTKPHFCYVLLSYVDDGNGNYALKAPFTDEDGNEKLYIYYYNYKTKKYTPKYITSLRVQDVETVYHNIKDKGVRLFDRAGDGSSFATLTLNEIDAYYQSYHIRPFAYKNGDVNVLDYADKTGAFYKVAAKAISGGDDPEGIPTEEPEQTDYPPYPMDEGDKDTYYSNMTGSDGYRYQSYNEEESVSMELDLKESGLIGGTTKTFDGYDICLSDAYLPGVSLEKGVQYAWVGGENIEQVRFSSDGRLRDVYCGAGGGSAELYFGTKGDNAGLDMFYFSADSLSFLQVYDKEDSPAFSDGVVLRTDGLAGGFGFEFYKGELESDLFEGSIGEDGDDIWIKIKAAKDAQSGEIVVSVWAELDDAEDPDFLPSFTGEPFFTTALHERVFPQETADVSASGGTSEGKGNEYGLKDGKSGGTALPDGELQFHIDAEFEKQTGASVDAVPLQKGVDYDAEKGSTIITLQPAFLSSLKDGAHTLTVYFTDGRMQTSFTTPFSGANSEEVPEVPATGGAPFGLELLFH